MNWQLQEVRIENLFNYSDCKVAFDKDMTALVVGENLDSEGANSNGAGKSSLFDAITWVIWGNSPRGSSFENLIIKRGTNHAGGSITLIDSNMTLLQIVRTKQLSPAKSSLSFCQIDSDGEVETDLSLRTQTLTQKAINTYFGFDEKNGFSDYLSQVYFSNTSTKGFLSSDISPSERQQILERFLNLSVLDRAAEVVKKDAKEVKSNMDTCDGKIDTVEGLVNDIDNSKFDNLDLIEAAIADNEVALEADQLEKEKTKDILEKYNFIRADYAKAVVEFDTVKAKARLKKTQYEKESADNDHWLSLRDDWQSKSDRYTEVLEGIAGVQTQLAGVQTQRNLSSSNLERSNVSVRGYRQQLHQLGVQLDVSQPCPHCSESLMYSGGTITAFNKAEIESEIEEVKETIRVEEESGGKLVVECADLVSQISTINLEKDGLQTKLNGFKKLKDSVDSHDYSIIDSLISDMQGLGADYTSTKQRVEVTEEERDNYISSEMGGGPDVLTVQLKKLGDDCLNYTTTIASYKKEMIEISESKKMFDKLDKQYSDLVGKKKLLSLVNSKAIYWAKAFPAIKRDILRNFVPLFEMTVNQYLKDLEITERVRFALEGTTKKGTIKSGFKIDVFDGNHWAPFNSYSGGEKSRILVSVGFAMKDLASQQVGNTSFGFLLCDEILDDLDSTGIDFFFSILKKVDGQKFIITHTKPDEASVNCTHTMTAVKHNGNSSVRVA